MSKKRPREAVTVAADKRLRGGGGSDRSTPAAPPRAPIDRVLLAILALAFLVRLGVLLQLHDHPLLRPSPQLDTGVYLDLARRVAGGDLLGGDRVFFVSPFYIYFMALVLAVSGGSAFAVQLVQVVLGTAAVWLVADTGRLWFGRRGGWVAGGLAALTGYFVFNESLLLQSAIDPFLTALGLWALARAWVGSNSSVPGAGGPSSVPRSGRSRASALLEFLLAGLVLGLHSLNRPNVLPWAGAAVVLTAVVQVVGARKSERAREGFLPVAAMVLGLFVALAPVALRNYAVGGQLALVSSHGGLNFYIGNNARADGTYRLVAGITPSISGQARDMRRVAEQAIGHPVSDVEASSWFYDQATAWIRSHPGAALWLFMRKIAYVFNAEDIPLNDSFTYYSKDESLLLRALIVGPWLLLPLGLAGVWLGRRRSGNAGAEAVWWAWVAFIPIYALSVAIFFVTGRYRLPLLVPLCVLSAGTVVRLLGLWSPAATSAGTVLRHAPLAGAIQQGPGRPSGLPEASRAEALPHLRSLAGPVLALAILFLATNWNLGLDNGLAGWRSEMVLYDVQAGRNQEAMELLARVEPTYPNRGLLLYRVGRAFMTRGDAQQALAMFERGLHTAPDRGELQVAAGEALLQLGRPGEAISILEAARRTPAVGDRATLALARANVAAGRVGEGVGLLRALSAPERLDAPAQLAAGQLALENGDGAVAEPFLQRAVNQAPGNPEAREALGLALAMQGRREDAAGVLEQACRLDPSSASSRLNLAILYAEMGRLPEARQLAEDALRLRPDYGRARQFLQAIGR